MKDLPKVYANKIDKELKNNRTFSYGKLDEDVKRRDDTVVRDKINKIFKSTNNIYLIDCIITFEKNEERYTIIGKTDNNLVTKNQKLIPIREIYDISLA